MTLFFSFLRAVVSFFFTSRVQGEFHDCLPFDFLKKKNKEKGREKKEKKKIAEKMPLRVCVVGGGIMGLSTALELVQRRELAGQSISVEVHSAAWGADTTSAGAGGEAHCRGSR